MILSPSSAHPTITLNFMDVRDGIISKKTVSADATVCGAFCTILPSCKNRQRVPVLMDKSHFFLAKHDDGSWLNRYSSEGRAIFHQRKVLPPLAAMLERPPLDEEIRLMHPDILGKQFVYDPKEIHIMYILPYKSRVMRWYERVRGRPCGCYGTRSSTWTDPEWP